MTAAQQPSQTGGTSLRVLGLISGTSHDGVDFAVVEFDQDRDQLSGAVLSTGSVPYPDELRARVVDALPPRSVTMAAVTALDTLLGQHFAEVAAMALADHRGDLVVSHGQTIYHWVEGGHALGTLQLGQPAWIAERTGLPVLSDLRSTDIAAGGHGAPLVPVLDRLLLAGLPGTTAALNLGGIANMTVLGPAVEPYAYDLGPANALIDAAVVQASGGEESFDEGGRLAASGTVNQPLLQELLDEPYYALPPPKSTGKELFHGGYLPVFLAHHPGLSPADVVATATALTAEVVAREVRRADAGILVASGGGVANPTLMRWIGEALPGVALRTTAEFGAPTDTKEAIAFALIGYLTAHGLPGNVPSCTGARAARVLGTLTAGHVLALPPVSTPEWLVLR